MDGLAGKLNCLHDPLLSLLERDPRRRPTSQLFSMNKFFADPGVHALQYLDGIQLRESAHRNNFYQSLTGLMHMIPKVSSDRITSFHLLFLFFFHFEGKFVKTVAACHRVRCQL